MTDDTPNPDDIEIKVFGSEDFQALWVLQTNGELEFKAHPDLDPKVLARALIESAFGVMTEHGLTIADIKPEVPRG